MEAQIIAIPTTGQSITQDERIHNEFDWLRYFDLRAGLMDVYSHIATLPSSDTKERHTLRGYDRDLKHFLNFIGAQVDQDRLASYRSAADFLVDYSLVRLPTAAIVRAYIAWLRQGKGLAPSTVSKYMAPVRILLDKLHDQNVAAHTRDDRDAVADIRHQLEIARKVKNPPATKKTSLGGLYAHGVRLKLNEVKAVLAHARADETLQGVRDYALVALGFTSALRVAELARLSLNNIKDEGGEYIATVRGKRNNYTPVVLESMAYEAIMRWVRRYNGGIMDDEMGLGMDDPRLIRGDVPIFQAVNNRTGWYAVGNAKLKIEQGISPRTIARTIWQVTGLALSPLVTASGVVVDPSWEFSPHDMRRTWAAMAYDADMPLASIQQQLRHANLATTAKYIGPRPDFNAQKLSAYVKIS